MPRSVANILSGCVLLVLASPGQAEEPSAVPAAVSDAVYKGVVGKALDAVPMDPEHRMALQRANAVVSNTLTGRSLSIWAGLGLTNPIFLVGGLAWGIFSASRIKADGAPPITANAGARNSGNVQTTQGNVAVSPLPSSSGESPAVTVLTELGR